MLLSLIQFPNPSGSFRRSRSLPARVHVPPSGTPLDVFLISRHVYDCFDESSNYLLLLSRCSRRIYSLHPLLQPYLSLLIGFGQEKVFSCCYKILMSPRAGYGSPLRKTRRAKMTSTIKKKPPHAGIILSRRIFTKASNQ